MHRWTSDLDGVAPTFLAAPGHAVLVPVLPDGDFAEVVRVAQDAVDRR
jgi:hypothetical protein